MLALAAFILICLHLHLGWWTVAAALAYLPVLAR